MMNVREKRKKKKMFKSIFYQSHLIDHEKKEKKNANHLII